MTSRGVNSKANQDIVRTDRGSNIREQGALPPPSASDAAFPHRVNVLLLLSITVTAAITVCQQHYYRQIPTLKLRCNSNSFKAIQTLIHLTDSSHSLRSLELSRGELTFLPECQWLTLHLFKITKRRVEKTNYHN